MSIFRDKHAVKNRNTNVYKQSFGRVEQCKYLGTNQTNYNSIHEEIRSRL